MCEDFGDFGDESFLDEHNFLLEQRELDAMAWEEQQDILFEEQALADEMACEARWELEYDDPMDGDAESALASCGWGMDEDYAPDCGMDYDM